MSSALTLPPQIRHRHQPACHPPGQQIRPPAASQSQTGRRRCVVSRARARSWSAKAGELVFCTATRAATHLVLLLIKLSLKRLWFLKCRRCHLPAVKLASPSSAAGAGIAWVCLPFADSEQPVWGLQRPALLCPTLACKLRPSCEHVPQRPARAHILAAMLIHWDSGSCCHPVRLLWTWAWLKLCSDAELQTAGCVGLPRQEICMQAARTCRASGLACSRHGPPTCQCHVWPLLSLLLLHSLPGTGPPGRRGCAICICIAMHSPKAPCAQHRHGSTSGCSCTARP